ncbi:unnamed protein product [Allacma fusca]|uniref:C2H2-type domain-containing protein n=1 Tax=Allacma fusca TaxID=39272 RepID=A0A8J2JCF8_9HEXA|nr:unnamed protein product [Allacma fusca]
MAEKKTCPKKTSPSFPYQPVRTQSQNDHSGCFKIPRPKKSRSLGNEPGWKCPICNFKVCQESLLLEHVQKIHLADTSCALVGIRAISNSYEKKSGK